MGLSKSQINALITYVDNEIPPRVRRILQSFGTDAHLYLPGVGVIDGFTAGNYQDSAGTTAGAVDSVVGLELDGAGSVGSELCPLYAQSVTSNTFGSTVAGAATGKTYKISATVTKTSGTGSVDVGITNASYGWHTNGTAYTSANGTFSVSFIVKSTDSTVSPTVIFTNAVGSVTNFSVREITGTHASQSTTANKPLLKSSGGKYYWQFDGSNDSLALGSVPFQMADDHCVVASVLPSVNTKFAFSVGNGTVQVCNIGSNPSGYPFAEWKDNSGTTQTLSYASNLVGSAHVLSGRKVSNDKVLRVNGVSRSTGSTAMGTATVTAATIGAQAGGGSLNWNGNIYCLIAIKGTVSDADIAVLEKWAGRLAGVTI